MIPIIPNAHLEAGLLIPAQENGINEMEEVEKGVTNSMTPSKTAHGLAEKKIGRLIRAQGISMIQTVSLMTISMTSEA